MGGSRDLSGARVCEFVQTAAERSTFEAGFESIATVTLLLKETLVRVAEPALVPAGVR